MKASIGWVVLLVSLQGCALFSKGDVSVRRFYSADLPPLPAGQETARHPEVELRLGRVSANRTIAERIMYRASEHEVGFYDDRVWTERPEAYVRRALSRVLFEEQGIKAIVGGPSQTLDVELLMFEEVKTPVHLARVRLAFTLADERTVSLQQTMTIDQPIANTSPEEEGPALAKAMGVALRESMNELTKRILAR